MHIFQTNPLSESCACVAVQEASSLRTSPSWPRCAPRLASSPSSCPSTMSRGSNSWAWSWVAPLSSCTRTRPASQPPKTTPCSAASTWPMESKSGQHTRKCSLCCPSFKTNDQFLKQRNYIATERGALRRIQWKVENLRALVKVISWLDRVFLAAPQCSSRDQPSLRGVSQAAVQGLRDRSEAERHARLSGHSMAGHPDPRHELTASVILEPGSLDRSAC